MVEVCWSEEREELIATGFVCNDIRVVQLNLVDGDHVTLRHQAERWPSAARGAFPRARWKGLLGLGVLISNALGRIPCAPIESDID